jgi:hypothetical protein
MMLVPLILLMQVNGPLRGTSVSGILPLAIRVQVDAMRVWDPANGRVLHIVPWSYALDALYSGRVPMVAVTTLRLDPDPGRTTTQTVTDTVAPRAQHRTGAQVFPGGSGAAEWSLEVAAGSGPIPKRKIKVEGRSDPLPKGPLVLSDLVAGTPNHSTTATIGSEVVTLAPRTLVRRADEITLWFQVRSEQELRDARATITITRIVGENVDDEQILSVAFNTDIGSGITSFDRAIDATRLGGSRYRLDVSVVSADGSVRAEQTTMLEMVGGAVR